VNDWTAIAVSAFHTCGLRAGGALYCYGANDSGQLGVEVPDPTLTPTLVPGGPWRAVTAGWAHTCALDTGGALWCWGNNFTGQLGLGDEESRTAPAKVAGDARWESVSTGYGLGFTCGVATDGARFCWGENGAGELGDGNGFSATPMAVGP
jgi:alpha-tubulin suppressor-like RCC1 family protein